VYRESFVIFVGEALTAERSDFQFDVVDIAAQRFFVESALFEHWGETRPFVSRVAICVHFRTILAVDRTAERFFRVCALNARLFILKLTDHCPVFEARLATIEGDSGGTNEEIVTAWRN
jgi:hypothetical protein